MKKINIIKRQRDGLSSLTKNNRIRLELIDGELYEGFFAGWKSHKLVIQSLNRKKKIEVNPIFIEICYEELCSEETEN